MYIRCPSNCLQSRREPGFGRIVRFGFYYRNSDRKKVQRYKCALCGLYFSQATMGPCYRQKRRDLNKYIFKNLVSEMSQRRSARLLKCHRRTVARKLTFLGQRARYKNYRDRKRHYPVAIMQFDDMETFEHTKLKPLSITLAVEHKTRFILGFEVSRMPAKGLLAEKSRKKYGYRKDERSEARDRLFRRIKAKVAPDAVIQSDQNPHYPEAVRLHFPRATHETVKGQRGAITGQGELKKIGFDPLFSLNHTCAMYRANVNRLIRKTWCTTKKLQPLIDHLEIYTMYHNRVLISREVPASFICESS